MPDIGSTGFEATDAVSICDDSVSFTDFEASVPSAPAVAAVFLLRLFNDSEPVLEPARARAVSPGFRFAALFVYSDVLFKRFGIVFFLEGY